MKHEQLYTFLCAAGISFCLGLGSVGALASGLGLPVQPLALVIVCAILALIISGLACLRFGSLISLGLGSILLLNPDFWTELKTVAATVAQKLYLAYGIPIPAFLEGELSQQVLSALCLLAGLIMVATARSVQKQKTSLFAAVLSLLPLAGCITVVDTVPDSPWLYLWGLGLVLLLMTQLTRRQSVRQGNRLTALLAVPVAAVLLLLFWLVPRDAPSRWSIARIPEQILAHFSGPSDTGITLPDAPSPPKVDLSNLEERLQKQTPIMDVTAGFTGALYLRSRDYDEYTGTHWNSTENRTEEIYGFLPEWHVRDGFVEISVRRAKDFYYLPVMTQQTQLLTDGQAANPDLETSYQFDYCRIRDDWTSKWEDTAVSTVNPRYLKLPDDTQQGIWTYLSGQEELINAMLDDLSAPDQAQLIAQHLQNLVPYDLTTPNMTEGESDLALWFLNRAESGYCVHYATAATVLLRACGIPARYVEGFAIQVEEGRTATVRELHAHAWAEYYVNGIGWLILDATPSDGTALEEPVTTEPTETEPVTTTAPTVPTTAPSQTTPKPGNTEKTPPHWVAPLLLCFAGCAMSVLLLWGQYRLRRKLFHRALRRGDPNQRALVIHRRLCRLSKWTKQPVAPELTQLAQKAKFSPHTLTRQELSHLQGHLQLAESAVSLLPSFKRLPAKWLFARY